MADITVIDHGSICIMFGTSDAGRAWLDEHLDPDAMHWGRGTVVEPRYVPAVIAGALLDDLEIAGANA